MKSVRIRSSSGPYFPAFGLNTERYSVSLHIQSECEKIRTRNSVSLRFQSECRKIQTRKASNTDTFHALIPLLGRYINDVYWERYARVIKVLSWRYNILYLHAAMKEPTIKPKPCYYTHVIEIKITISLQSYGLKN